MTTIYQRYKCYEMMSSSDRERFDKIVEGYEKQLNVVDHEAGTVFTAHDFDHHCIDLYWIISNILLSDIALSQEKSGLQSREIYILNIAILLHDIGLHSNTVLDRDKHAIESARIIEENYKNSSDTICQDKSDLRVNEERALELIIKAHHDLTGAEFGSAINDKELDEDIKGIEGRIRTKVLAAVLRMADELDITNNRMSSTKISAELEKAEKALSLARSNGDGDQKKIEKLENSVESLKYWRELNYFKSLDIDKQGKVWAILDDRYIQTKDENGDSIEDIAEQIIKRKEKILREFKLFHGILSESVETLHLTNMTGFDIKTSYEPIRNILSKRSKTSEDDKKKDQQKVAVNVIDKDVEKKISNFIKRKDLIEGGHFFRRGEYCARDWINVREITGTSWFFKKSENLILSEVERIIKNSRKKYFVIGIDFAGMLLGSKVALVLDLPYTFAIPEDEENHASKRELKVGVSEGIDAIIIMTDVIVTYRTIKNIIEKYHLENKVEAIFGVLYRKPIIGTGSFYTDQELISITHVLNAEFGIELVCSDNCPIKNSYRCIAANLDKE